jgi:hypothetical protein
VSVTQAVQTWTTIPDKTSWGDGEWAREPDKAQWPDAATGLTCLALRHPDWGYWCGYVGVPSTHPLHGLAWDDVPGIEIHDSLTYFNTCDDDAGTPIEQRICHVPAPGELDDVWWFGFSCGGAFDLRPAAHARFLGVEALAESQRDLDRYLTYRTLGFVQAECAKLAAQLAGCQPER